MATIEQWQAALAAVDAATNDLAVEVARLRELIVGGGLTPVQEQQVLDDMLALEAKLRAIGQPPV